MAATASPHLHVDIDGNEVVVRSDFLGSWSRKANGIGGRNVDDAWRFHVASLELIRESLMATFGEDGTPTERVDLLWTLDRADSYQASLELGGRVAVRRPSRDMAVRLGRDVAVVAGEFPPEGGSMKNPEVCGEGVQLRLMGVPKVLAEQLVAKSPARGSIVASLA